MRNLAENPLRIIGCLTALATFVVRLNTANGISSAEEFPPMPTPRPLQDSYWDGMTHIIRNKNFELAVTKFCGGEDGNENNNQHVLLQLQIDDLAQGQKPEFEVWDYKDTPAITSRYPTTVNTQMDRRSATLSKVLPLGIYSFFVRNGGNVIRLTDQRIFECPGPLDLNLYE